MGRTVVGPDEESKQVLTRDNCLRWGRNGGRTAEPRRRDAGAQRTRAENYERRYRGAESPRVPCIRTARWHEPGFFWARVVRWSHHACPESLRPRARRTSPRVPQSVQAPARQTHPACPKQFRLRQRVLPCRLLVILGVPAPRQRRSQFSARVLCASASLRRGSAVLPPALSPRHRQYPSTNPRSSATIRPGESVRAARSPSASRPRTAGRSSSPSECS